MSPVFRLDFHLRVGTAKMIMACKNVFFNKKDILDSKIYPWRKLHKCLFSVVEYSVCGHPCLCNMDSCRAMPDSWSAYCGASRPCSVASVGGVVWTVGKRTWVPTPACLTEAASLTLVADPDLVLFFFSVTCSFSLLGFFRHFSHLHIPSWCLLPTNSSVAEATSTSVIESIVGWLETP